MQFRKVSVLKRDGAHFVNLDNVDTVTCSVDRNPASRGVDIAQMLDGDGAVTTGPIQASEIAVVTLHLASGTEEVLFGKFEDAEKWLVDHFNIHISFDQL